VATGIGTGSSVNDKLESIRKETVYSRIWLGGGGGQLRTTIDSVRTASVLVSIWNWDLMNTKQEY
jgi:hypothetical protein